MTKQRGNGACHLRDLPPALSKASAARVLLAFEPAARGGLVHARVTLAPRRPAPPGARADLAGRLGLRRAHWPDPDREARSKGHASASAGRAEA